MDFEDLSEGSGSLCGLPFLGTSTSKGSRKIEKKKNLLKEGTREPERRSDE